MKHIHRIALLTVLGQRFLIEPLFYQKANLLYSKVKWHLRGSIELLINLK